MGLYKKKYGAVFIVEEKKCVVGPFLALHEAMAYGDSLENKAVTFTGEVLTIMGPGHFERYIAALEVRISVGGANRTSDGRWVGVVTRVEQSFGFITSGGGGSWFFSKTDDDGNDPDALTLGTRVCFRGNHQPVPGKQYPRAYSVSVLNVGTEVHFSDGGDQD